MIDNGGHRLAFYVTQGTGPTIVLDSGGGEDSSYWKDLVPELHAATGATVITYDRAGLGKSDVVPGPWQVESAVSDLEAGLQQLGVTDDVTPVSHSEAGQIATSLAQDNPALLSGAVLVDADLSALIHRRAGSRGWWPSASPSSRRRRRTRTSRRTASSSSTAESFVATSTGLPPGRLAGRGAGDGHRLGEDSVRRIPRRRPALARRSSAAPRSSTLCAAAGPHRTPVTAEGSSHRRPEGPPRPRPAGDREHGRRPAVTHRRQGAPLLRAAGALSVEQLRDDEDATNVSAEARRRSASPTHCRKSGVEPVVDVERAGHDRAGPDHHQLLRRS